MNESAVTTPSQPPPGMDAVALTCACGTALYVPRALLGGRGRCTRCGRVHRLVEKRQCGICQWEISSDAATHACPSCGSIFHAECWAENRGCSAYGCAQVGALKGPDDAAGDEHADDRHVEVGAARSDSDEETRDTSWEIVLLSASIAAALLGAVTFGVPALAVAVAALVHLLRYGRRARVPLLVVAIATALLGTIAGAGISILWWFPGLLRP